MKGPVLIIILSAIYHPASKNSKFTNHKEVYFFPYSDHSCHSELKSFVSELKPHYIYPIVSTSKVPKTIKGSPGPLNYLLNSQLETTRCNSVIPKSILRYSKNSKNQDAFKETSNKLSVLQQEPNSYRFPIKDSSKLSFNTDKTNKNNKRERLRKAFIRGHNDILMDHMSSENTSAADLLSSDETIKPNKNVYNPETSSIISNDNLTMDNQCHLLPRALKDSLTDTSSSLLDNYSPDANLTEEDLFKTNESFSSGESDSEYYPLSQDECRQQKNALECKSHKKQLSNTNCTINIVNQAPNVQSCEMTESALEDQKRLPSSKHTKEIYCTGNDSSKGVSHNLNNSSEETSSPSKSLGMSREDTDIDFVSVKTHYNASQINGKMEENSANTNLFSYDSDSTLIGPHNSNYNGSELPINRLNCSGTKSEVSMSLLQSSGHRVSTGHFNNISSKLNSSSFECVNDVHFNKQLDEVFMDNFHHAFKTWENSIDRSSKT